MRAKQLSFLPRHSLEHGGDTRRGKRKIARPLDPKRPIHLTLRSSRARGSLSLLRPAHRGPIERLLHATAKRRGLRILRFANVGNHLHLVVQIRTRRGFQAFLREITGKIATLVTGAVKGSPSGPFWDHLAWSRVVSWGHELKHVFAYLLKNMLEAEGAKRKDPGGKDYPLITPRFDPPPD